jgi:hypothetical protein
VAMLTNHGQGLGKLLHQIIASIRNELHFRWPSNSQVHRQTLDGIQTRQDCSNFGVAERDSFHTMARSRLLVPGSLESSRLVSRGMKEPTIELLRRRHHES